MESYMTDAQEMRAIIDKLEKLEKTASKQLVAIQSIEHTDEGQLRATDRAADKLGSINVAVWLNVLASIASVVSAVVAISDYHVRH
jgi:hypothetical protein